MTDTYKIILVDDEEEARTSIMRKIGWEAVGFSVVGDAENGEDALEKIEATEPDVVLTDIRMPYMDGLTLAARIRRDHPSMKVVIFSGYDDFEYAKQAIKLGVTEYILKPVNVEELTAILLRLKESLDAEIEQKRNVSALRENYIRSLPILRGSFLSDLTNRNLDETYILEKIREYAVPIEGARKWICAAVDVGDPYPPAPSPMAHADQAGAAPPGQATYLHPGGTPTTVGPAITGTATAGTPTTVSTVTAGTPPTTVSPATTGTPTVGPATTGTPTAGTATAGPPTLPIHREKGLVPLSVMQMLGEKLTPYCRHAVFTSSLHAGSDIALIAAIDEGNTQTGLIGVLGDVCKEAQRVLKVPVTIGVGHSCLTLGDISRAYKQSVDALGYKAIVGSGSTIYLGDVEPGTGGKLLFSPKDEGELIAAVKFGPPARIAEAVERIAARMDDAKVHFRQFEAYTLSVTNCVVVLAQQYDLDMSRIFQVDADMEGTLAFIPKFQKKGDFGQWLLQVAMRLHDAFGQERENSSKQVIEDAKRYILDHYHEPDLSVERICRHLHMSLAYFSTLFKKETGQTYINYLTEVRLNKALELLNKTDDKTYVIAAKVGYQEQNYFSYVFKKRFGVSPTKYRGEGRAAT